MENETLIAENVEIDMETLCIATSSALRNHLAQYHARIAILDAVEYALSPEDRKKLEEYREQ